MQTSVFDSPKPTLTDDEVARLAREHFGISGPLRLSLIHISEPTRPY